MKNATTKNKKRKKKHIYRFSITDESRLKELWNLRLSKPRYVLLIITIVLFLTIVVPYIFLRVPQVRALFFIDDPNTINIELLQQKEKVDSLTFDILLQKQYLNSIKTILADDVLRDTIPPLDSLKLMLQDKLVANKDSDVLLFMNEYEAKQAENTQRIGLLPYPVIPSFFIPAQGKITPYKKGTICGVVIATGTIANVYSVLRGTVINITQQANLCFELTILHEGYISIYRNVDKVIHKNGDIVHSGEVIGFINEKHHLQYEIWQNGKNVNPQDIIGF